MFSHIFSNQPMFLARRILTTLEVLSFFLMPHGWAGVGWGEALTFLFTCRHRIHGYTTLWYLLLHLNTHTHWMLRYDFFSCTCRHAWCHAIMLSSLGQWILRHKLGKVTTERQHAGTGKTWVFLLGGCILYIEVKNAGVATNRVTSCYHVLAMFASPSNPQGHPNAPLHWAFHGHRLAACGAREVFPGHGCGAEHPRLCLGPILVGNEMPTSLLANFQGAKRNQNEAGKSGKIRILLVLNLP